ncbi:multifunctional CCA tRNA nucleotidyl transferase/2'3'-cyclic phosphodiesterase/2'nucleotidase/phosphatase [Alkanindiges hydrocarboniclasticus]|uniref:Multifunctional CCA protein n=1 Tax=Alkanindiges hydrocarboniclasticus TaxID=1907941 RepID=A0A1S8CYE5_9GAMM|nr:multifunctional CCA addition/repair protein [Alkanindiges hydrocarboniclasticus]ONG41665.1 multifunctional CCA tRNA nucleotidyl transferase/2'3'-cyclic phosphodiesterase/2'nucleotidase/phosphatase [Alkanindiges hydrocarboniclasticus]
MQVYLVGGAVRDQLLGRTVSERDYVVVGATPEQMLAAGYMPVGSDFPVFLHPHSKEEYALARTERKSGVGYGGFTFYTSPDLSLEEDLIRRDLTINAMALAEDGRVIDPYGGQQDLQDRLLRHVSPAFIEDPLRVLRVARFAARYAPLGFTVAPETLSLMQSLVNQGEINHLTPERIWKETQRALTEDRADVYFEVLRDCGALQVIMPEVNALFGVPQRPEYHPEVDTGIHTLMTLQRACEAQYSDRVRFATVMHDLGKALTPVDLLPRHADHEARGVEPIKNLCKRLKVPSQYQQLAELVCREHLLCHRVMELRPGTIWRLLQRLDVLRRPERVEEFIQACECDARGRLGLEKRPYEQADFMREAIQRVRNIRAVDLPSHIQGPDIGEALIEARIDAITVLKNSYADIQQG